MAIGKGRVVRQGGIMATGWLPADQVKCSHAGDGCRSEHNHRTSLRQQSTLKENVLLVVGSLRRERRHEGGGGLSVLLGNGYERSHVLWVDYMSNSDY